MGRPSSRPVGELWEEVKRRRSDGATLEELAQWLSDEEVRLGIRAEPRYIAVQTLTYWLKHEPPARSEQRPPDVVEVVDQALEAEAHKAQESHYKRLYQETLKRLEKVQTLYDVMKDVLPVFKPVHVRYENPPLTGLGEAETVVAELADMHFPEVVEMEAMGGLNAYNPMIANRRLHLWAKKIIQLVNLERKAIIVEDALLVFGGDMLGGIIHDELMRTNAHHIISSIGRLSYLLAQAVLYVAQHFQRVRTLCINGNHARLTKKKEFKEPWENYEYLLYQMLAFMLSKQPNVELIIPKAPYKVLEVRGWQELFGHGDWIRSWGGIPHYGIQRWALKIREKLAAFKPRIYYDDMHLYHFHTPSVYPLSTGWLTIGGSVKGADEYTDQAIGQYNRPIQWLYFVHPEKGLNDFKPLYLQEADDREDLGFKDALPDVWAEVMQ